MSAYRLAAPSALLALVLMIGATITARATPAEDLTLLCADYWQGYLESHPTEATTLGIHLYDDRLEDITPAGRKRERARLEAVLARANAIRDQELSAADRVTRGMLVIVVQDALDD